MTIQCYPNRFCEGFYLHRLIAAAFAEQKSFIIFYLIGWRKYCDASNSKIRA